MAEEREEPTIIVKSSELLQIKVSSASHTVKDEKGKVLYEKRKR